jgi:hypothetical protein
MGSICAWFKESNSGSAFNRSHHMQIESIAENKQRTTYQAHLLFDVEEVFNCVHKLVMLYKRGSAKVVNTRSLSKVLCFKSSNTSQIRWVLHSVE